MERTDFGQSRFGHPDLTNFGQSNFGQSNFGQFISGSGVCRPKGGAQTQKKSGPEAWGAQNFALFFSVSPPPVSLFLLSLGVFSWNFGGV